MRIPSVVQGMIETENGKRFSLASAKGMAWLETIGSFRYEPLWGGKPYTVRREGKNGEYWYGCRKIAGKVRKKYIGKSSEISLAKLDEIAEALETAPEPRVNKVAEVGEQVAEVTQSPQVVEQVAESRVTVLEVQVAELLKAVKDIQEALPGKSDAGNFEELPKVDNEVVERLQNELSNLKAENERLREEVREVRSQLETEQARFKELDDQCDDYEKWWKEEEGKVADRDKIIAELRSENSELKQNSALGVEFPEADKLLNQLKARRKKSTASLADVESILEILEES